VHAEIWFDNPEHGQQYAAWLKEHGLFRKRKMRVLVHEMDANEMLVRGYLHDFLDKEES
jgi:hypothetical protein